MGYHGQDVAASRTSPRFKLFQPTTMAMGTDIVRVHLLDLSATGALLHRDVPPAVDSRIRVECVGRKRLARVVWVKGPRFGISFALPLADEQIEEALAEQRAVVAAHTERFRAAA